MKISVIMPVYNEAATVEEILSRVLSAPPDFVEKEIILVDDASTDGTRQKLEEISRAHPEIRVLYHEKNRGKGAALRTGFQHASGEIIVIQDADLEYDPRDYPKLLEPILDGRADVVFGSRFLGWPRRVLFFWHYVGNKILTLLSNMLNNLNLSDMETCYKVFRREILSTISLRSDRFGFEPEFTGKVAKKKFRIYEVPVSYSGRDYTEGKKADWTDGVAAIFLILWYRLFD